jgi:hypothetical protein
MTDNEAAIKKCRDALDAARKKLMGGGKGGNGAESTYADAYAALCKVDPTQRPLRGKYRRI